MRVTNRFLLGSKAYSTRGSTCLALESGQEPTTEDLTGSRGEPTTIILLNRCNMEVSSIFIATHILAQKHQRSFFLKLKVVNRDSRLRLVEVQRSVCGVLRSGTFISHLLLKAQGLWKRDWETVRAKVRDGGMNSVFWCDRTAELVGPAALVACTRQRQSTL